MNSARVIYLQSTASTMADATALAVIGEPHGTVVVSEVQTGGIGRQGHAWHSADLGGLYFSMVLRTDLPPEQMPVLTMALGLAVQSAVNDHAQVSCDLRWPNDVLLNEKKLAGILVQSAGGACIAGIGLNVNQKSFPPDLSGIATSLALETGRTYSKADLLDALRTILLPYVHILADRGKREIFRLFTNRSSYVSGKHVEVDLGGRVIQGITAGLDDDGFLLVNTSKGREKILAGGVRPVNG